MRLSVLAPICAGAIITLSGASAHAQSWTGAYLGTAIGGGIGSKNPAETISFDTNLDGAFADTVRTAAGANGFSPGFCGGLAVNAMAAAGCTRDKNGAEIAIRGGYDRQLGRVLLGGLIDVSTADLEDSVTAFSTTPAFYAFTRRLDVVTGFRGRAGFGAGRVLVYGTGGGAWGNVEQTFTTSNRVNTFVPSGPDGAPASLDSTESVWGYQAGGGVEVRLARRLNLVGEYLFTNLDNRADSQVRSQVPAPATNAFVLVNAAGTDFRRTQSFEFHSVRVGVNYRF